ncbi:hypothetical protein [Desulfosporosinus meridiei]|nr:hypothetical protein [Desulfosporosinus meridiei]
METFKFNDGSYTLVFAGGSGDEFTHPDFPGLDLDLDRVFFRPRGG